MESRFCGLRSVEVESAPRVPSSQNLSANTVQVQKRRLSANAKSTQALVCHPYDFGGVGPSRLPRTLAAERVSADPIRVHLAGCVASAGTRHPVPGWPWQVRMLWLFFALGAGGGSEANNIDPGPMIFGQSGPPRGRSFGRRFRQEGDWSQLASGLDLGSGLEPGQRVGGSLAAETFGGQTLGIDQFFFRFSFFPGWFGVPNGRKSGQCLKTRRGTKSQWLVTQTCRREVRLSSTNPFSSDIAYSEAPGAHRSLTRNSAKMVLSQYDYIFAIGTFFALLDA